jgi:hypothetical protein
MHRLVRRQIAVSEVVGPKTAVGPVPSVELMVTGVEVVETRRSIGSSFDGPKFVCVLTKNITQILCNLQLRFSVVVQITLKQV